MSNASRNPPSWRDSARQPSAAGGPAQAAHTTSAPSGLYCPRCGSKARLGSTKDIWPKLQTVEPMWLCAGYPACDSYVRCHNGTTDPVGTLAGPRLRRMRQRLHGLIDPLWKEEGIPRPVVYDAIDHVMQVKDFHIGSADELAAECLLRRIDAVRERAMQIEDHLHRFETGRAHLQPASSSAALQPAEPSHRQHPQHHPSDSDTAVLLDILHAIAHDIQGRLSSRISGQQLQHIGDIVKQLAGRGWIEPEQPSCAGTDTPWRLTDQGRKALLQDGHAKAG